MADEPELSTGATGEWVTYLQQLLEYKQFGSGFSPGSFDDTTAQAVGVAQQHYSLPQTGTADEATWNALRSEDPGGDSGEQVPDDIAMSIQDEVAAPGDEVTLSELEDMPSTMTA